MIKAILFDMDGVLSDTEPLHFMALQMLMKTYNIFLPDSSFEDYIGISEEKIWEVAREEYKIKDGFIEFEDKRRGFFYRIIKESMHPAKGLHRLMEELEKNKIKIALVTSSGKKVADAVLEQLNIRQYFDVMVTADDVKNKKPHNEPYLLALRRLGVNPKDGVAVEDSPHGIESAKSSGLFCIGVDTYNKKEIVSMADMAVASLDEITLEKIAGKKGTEKYTREKK